MPSSRFLIASNTLSSSAASVTFSSIPSTYTDLVLKVSARSDQSGNTDSLLIVRLNSDTSNLYSSTLITGSGSTASSLRTSSTNSPYSGSTSAASATSNTFGNAELYIPNYNASANKPFSVSSAAESNTATSNSWFFNGGTAGLYRSTNAITSIELLSLSGSINFVSGSSFWLYGLKNS